MAIAHGHIPSAAWPGLLDGSWLEELDATPFLGLCRSRAVTRDQMDRFLQQQYFYARHFTRYLAALISNLEQEGDRELLTRNLFDEMGLGGQSGDPHALIYRKMLDRMNISTEPRAILPPTKALADKMLACCQRNHLLGLGALCLGAEAIVGHVYRQILEGLDALGVDEQDREFFRLHIETDDEHALTMGALIRREVDADSRAIASIREGATIVIRARVQFFQALATEPLRALRPEARSSNV